MKKSLLIPFVTLFFTGVMAGCSNMEPWVKPYERENLADPIMSFTRDPVSAAYLHHVHEVREAARGAGSVSGGGCGCN